jgi:ribonuclease BN (tRNA processing enzyme)
MVNIDNIVTIPERLNSFLMKRGYIHRANKLEGREPANKFVVLRRWQSFNPIIPRPHGADLARAHVPGGGYFLVWNNKGIAIDPGFNFIQNLYDEGFSIEDIDAVIITHAHIDHDNELSNILTLLFEWNERCELESKRRIKKQNEKHDPRKPSDDDSTRTKKSVDLFLNEGSYRKFNSWLYSPSNVVKKIYLLQSNVFNNDHDFKKDRGIKDRRGNNIRIDLKDKASYNMVMEVIPAIHHEIIAENSAIGVKLILSENKAAESEDRTEFKIGITGDTYAYDGICESYEDCDILVAHLGDIKFRELKSLGRLEFSKRQLSLIFPKVDNEDGVKNIREFAAMRNLVDMDTVEEPLELLKLNGEKYDDVLIAISIAMNMENDYRYRNHLGIRGVFNLFRAMRDFPKKDPDKHKVKSDECAERDRLLIIGELPEELASFRHTLARILNEDTGSEDTGLNEKTTDKKGIRCITADIGLNVGFRLGDRSIKSEPKSEPSIKIKCHRCNQNTEMVSKSMHYHSIHKMQEVVIKRAGNSIVYLCEDCNHAAAPIHEPTVFINNLYPRYSR